MIVARFLLTLMVLSLVLPASMVTSSNCCVMGISPSFTTANAVLEGAACISLVLVVFTFLKSWVGRTVAVVPDISATRARAKMGISRIVLLVFR